MGQPEVLDQLLVRGRFLEWIEVVAVEVLHERMLDRRSVVGLAYERGDHLEADPPGGAPATLAGDQLVAVADRADEDRLEHPDLTDRVGERTERFLVEVVPGLEAVRLDRCRRQRLQAPTGPGVGVEARPRGDERSEALTQSAASRHRSPLSPSLGTPSRRATSGRTR